MNLGSGVLVLEKAGSRWTQCLVTEVKAVWSGSKVVSCPQCCESAASGNSRSVHRGLF